MSTTATAPTQNSLFYWDNIVLQVEDELFCIPRNEFVSSSEVFADMFCLPDSGGSMEGKDDKHPIVLEGYKKSEFISLLKVMYPTGPSLTSGTDSVLKLRLDKEEWVSVLKLSTIWNMKEIREYAIHRLSTDFQDQITPIEKILLARAHKVAKWLEEGVTSLVEGDPKPVDEFSPLNSWETVARILSMTVFMKVQQASEFYVSSIRCGFCTWTGCLVSSPGSYCCPGCSSYLNSSTVLTSTSARGPGECQVPVSSILSKCCGRALFQSWSVRCPSCYNYTYGPSNGYNHNIKVTPTSKVPNTSMKDLIGQHFGGEVEEYKRLWLESST